MTRVEKIKQVLNKKDGLTIIYKKYSYWDRMPHVTHTNARNDFPLVKTHYINNSSGICTYDGCISNFEFHDLITKLEEWISDLPDLEIFE